MPFVKALIWVAVLIVIVIFAVNNWVPVTIALWGERLLDTKLPVPIIGAFLIGWFPLYLIHKTSRWRARRQLRSLQGTADDMPRNYIPDPNAPAEPTGSVNPSAQAAPASPSRESSAT